MTGIKVEIVRFVSNDQPGFVECTFNDAWGKEHSIEEKIPVVTTKDLDENSDYPQGGIVACEVIKEWHDQDGRRLVTINIGTPWGVETTDGLAEFDILFSMQLQQGQILL
jgi:hypothetical protein